MYELYLNRLIDDEERSKEFLQELRNNNQMVTFLWEDSDYPFKDKLIETAKRAYEENSIEGIYTRVESVKNHWEHPWETMKCGEYSFKMRLGMSGYWKKWIKEFPWKLGLIIISVYTVLLGVMCFIMSIVMPIKSAFVFMGAMEVCLLSIIVLMLVHPAFFENVELTAFYDIALLLIYNWANNKFDDTAITIPLMFVAFGAIYTFQTYREQKKLAEYKPYTGYYYFH